MSNPTFLGQTVALIRKNLVVAVKRKWLSTIIRSLIIPIVLLVLLLEIQNFIKDLNRYGVGKIHPIRGLQDSLQGSKPIVVASSASLGADFPPILDRLEKSLGDHHIIKRVDEDEIESTCPVDSHGHSPCHAAIVFKNSPGSNNDDDKWEYNILTDPAFLTYKFDVFNANSGVERIVLPLQLEIDNAITNSTEIPDVQAFTRLSQKEADDFSRRDFQSLALYTLSFVFFITMVPVAHHVAGMVTYDRDSGMSQLVDAMGGDGAIWARVLSYVITFDILYLPLWIILGAVFWHLLLPGQNAGIVIFWQIFTGWSVTSASVFGAAFFKRHAFGSLFVTLIPILLAVIAAYTENTKLPPPLAQVVALSLLFPSMNYVYFFSAITKSEIVGVVLDLGTPVFASELEGSNIPGQVTGVNWVSMAGSYFLWIILIAQIFIFPVLAVFVEKALHGINRRRRDFDTSTEAVNSQVAIQTKGLSKLYRPSWFKKIFCCARTPKTKAVDNLDLTSYRNQILCLLGPNGSGKTTTLEMLSGFQQPTDGSVTINASSSQIGICPQKNVLWDNLTVFEHLTIWSAIKGSGDTQESLEQLIEQCDLVNKKNNLAASLSGGTKRKLQLACMLVGGSSICFADEITSGLDPLSRRVIWEVIKRERAQRTMVLTTHFLDESEVLSDHIMIITLGKMKCQGTPAELKNQYGGGYRVHIPKAEDISGLSHPVIEKHDRYVCRTPDSSSAARVLASLRTSANTELYITGPTIEDVFLKVAEEPHTLIGESPEEISLAESLTGESKPEATLSLTAVYARQIRALLLKRIILLRSGWWQYLFALGIPIIIAALTPKFLKDYETPRCDEIISSAVTPYPLSLYTLGTLALGPESANDTIAAIITEQNDGELYSYGDGEYGPYIIDTRDGLEDFVRTHTQNLSYSGGIWVGNNSNPFIAYDANSVDTAATLLNLLSQVKSGQKIQVSLSALTSYNQANGGNSVIWVTIFCLVQALYPAFFSLYPTYERKSQVRALQYSNGIRPFPTVFSYWVFDSFFVIIVAVICTVLIAPATEWFGVGYLFVVQALYGFAAVLFSYLVSFVARSQPAAFALSVLFMAIMYVLSIISLVVLNVSQSGNLKALDGTAYGLGLIFPIQNLLRGLTVSVNTYLVRCRGRSIVTYPGSIYAYGGPILLLVIQIIWIFVLVVWLEGGRLPFFSKPKVPVQDISDTEKTVLSGRPDVDAETARVMSSDSDLLRVQHVSKDFGSFRAVEDVSLGLQKGEILALLGPNGAGKTTTLNMIRGDLTPTSGRIYLQDIDVHKNTRLAQNNLGVCPQFDALDLLTVREHLSFYSRCKGVTDVKADVAYVMARVGITSHADKLAAKLSGGNKRKLSLGIALVGNPPVLLLDEPSSAMDAASKRVLWKTLEAIAPGRSVVITTHSMEEADALATRAAIVARRLLAIGTTEALRKTHSNEYHVHLILKSAPLSTVEEMEEVAAWVRSTFPGIKFEGENLGGQVRFIVPADSKVPALQLTTESTRDEKIGTGGTQSFTRYLIETLEAQKEQLNLDCYSISAATMESVFLRVVKELPAEDDGTALKKPWWRR
ncbi:hypothetical protein F5B22DRAFT_532271 [Xylaria bambusicola]|uniref:uncharacterized protein n=1 Tax=Xylaria bambusicola TaxID=326684 RepID=UPI002007C9BB|nr:uncharacterized protein F5B22DRAFT_532271 [Xylaria bambusicola]KAI0505291.1 hypothetical protein F5B22DRAFT_532271 [Xylaria bambusicola]